MRTRTLIQLAGQRLYTQLIKHVEESGALKQIETAAERLERRPVWYAAMAAKEGLKAYISSGEVPTTYALAREEESGLALLKRKEKRRLVHLEGLLIMTDQEQRELQDLTTKLALAPTNSWYQQRVQRVKGIGKKLSARVRRKEGQPPEPRRHDLDSLVTAAVDHYNGAVARYQEGERGALYQLHEKGANELGIEPAMYSAALRHYLITRRATGESRVLQRFDRSIMPNYQGFVEEAANAYESSDKTLDTVAEELTEKYGMKISRSHLSTIARKELRERDGYVANRREAKARYRAQEEAVPPPSAQTQ